MDQKNRLVIVLNIAAMAAIAVCVFGAWDDYTSKAAWKELGSGVGVVGRSQSPELHRGWLLGAGASVLGCGVLAAVAAVRRGYPGMLGFASGLFFPGSALVWCSARQRDAFAGGRRTTLGVLGWLTVCYSVSGVGRTSIFSWCIGYGAWQPGAKYNALIGLGWVVCIVLTVMLGGEIAARRGHKRWHGQVLGLLLWPAVYATLFVRGKRPVRA